MYCPQCGTQAEPGIKYCKKCGQALNRIRGVMSKGGASVNWNDVWMEEALDEHRKKRKKTPEEKRLEEIKAGVITSSAGLAITIFLSFLFDAIANASPDPGANILRSLWTVGFVPLFVGLGLIFNGVFVSRRLVELKRQQQLSAQQSQASPGGAAVDTAPVAQLPEPRPQATPEFGVTEHTTARLGEGAAIPARRDTD
jgi:hypothetical protein